MGEAIDGIKHPMSIEHIWPDEKLEKVGLYRVKHDPIPHNAVVKESYMELRDGRPHMKYYYELIEEEIVDDSLATLARKIRLKRQKLLEETDFWFLSDTPKPPPGMKAYRQMLRDITEQPTFPQTVEWPKKPLP